jgi:hypothetical protein
MNTNPPRGRFLTLDRKKRRQLGIRAALRIALTAALLLGLYLVAPVDLRSDQLTLVRLIVALVIVSVVVAVQVQSILSASYPLLRAVESVITALLVFIIVFSYLYLDLAHINPEYFSQTISHVSALYFTVTVLSTVGFGDITATNDVTRVVVVIQMLLDLTFIAIIIRIFFWAAQTRAGREATDPDLQTPTEARAVRGRLPRRRRRLRT